ncbi:MAG: glycosyltransferase family 87 protein [Planctomycetota bacterium]
MTDPPDTRPTLLRAVLVATLAGGAALAASCAALWPSAEALYAGFDFNAALFEDFLGPYMETARRLAGGDAMPAEGYLYPAFGALLLVPFAGLGPTAASWLCAALMLGATVLLTASALALVRPRSTAAAAVVGTAFFLAHGVAHGAYWGQASLVVAGLSAAGFALWSSGGATPHARLRSNAGAALLGVAAAIKLTPLVFLVAPIATRDRRAAGAALGTFVVCAVVLPLALLGFERFTFFHAEVIERLRWMASWVATPEGGRGSQDPGALFARAAGAPAWWVGRALGLAAALLIVGAAARALRASAPRERARALPLLAAVPWLVVGPTWPHALAWIPLAWWIAWSGRERTARPRAVAALVLSSVALGSVATLRLVGDPETFARLGFPFAAALLALVALLAAPGGPEDRNSGPAVSLDRPGGR